MPALSPTMTEGGLTKWLVEVGDKIRAGDILAEIETDKATMEIEAVDEGTITKIVVKEGTNSVPVNSIIAILDGLDDEVLDEEETFKQIIGDDINKILKKNDTQSIAKDYVEAINVKDYKSGNLDLENKKIKASPYAKKIAGQKNIDLSNVEGSGPHGRIIKRDLINNVLKKEIDTEGKTPSTMRKIIAERTTITKQTIPHFYITIESNVDKLLEMRKKINSYSDIKISINDILVKALALAQQINPKTNVSWIDNKIVKYNSVDVSIAVALEEGLVTPIIKNADKKGLKEISIEIKNLAEKAKKGKLLPEEYNGGTISISNLGMFGISEFSAIINPPQSSILAVGSIKKIPSVIKDEIIVANILKSTLSADHRVLDGAVAAKLLKDFNDIIEDPFKLWLKSNDMEII